MKKLFFIEILIIIVIILIAIGGAIIRFKVFGGDMRCVFVECRILK